jgi:hypothetical protein
MFQGMSLQKLPHFLIPCNLAQRLSFPEPRALRQPIANRL